MEERRPDPGETVHKREWMICWQLYVSPVQVTKIAKKILKMTPLAPSVESGIEIALRNGFVVMAVVCGITKKFTGIKRIPKMFYCEQCATVNADS